MYSMFFVSVLSGYTQHANSVSLATFSTHWNESGSQAMTGYVILYLHTFLFLFFSHNFAMSFERETIFRCCGIWSVMYTLSIGIAACGEWQWFEWAAINNMNLYSCACLGLLFWNCEPPHKSSWLRNNLFQRMWEEKHKQTHFWPLTSGTPPPLTYSDQQTQNKCF